MSVWETLSNIDVSEHTEEKNGLTYLSWAWAWGIVKDHYPKATFTKNLYSSANNDCTLPYMIDPAGYAFVSVTIEIDGEAQTEVLPVLNHANKAVSQPDSFQVNTALQRCLAKCCAMHGLGHYIYAGEDLPKGVERKVTIESSDGEKKDVEGLEMVAEGVEQEYQLRYLQQLKCPVVQGYVFSQGVPADEVRKFIQSTRQLLEQHKLSS